MALTRGYLPSVNRPLEDPDPLIQFANVAPNSPLRVSPESAGYSYDPYKGAYMYTGSSGYIQDARTNYAEYQRQLPYFEAFGVLGNKFGEAALNSGKVTAGGGSGLSFYKGDINVGIDHDLAYKQQIPGSLENLRQMSNAFNITRDQGLAAQETLEAMSSLASKYSSSSVFRSTDSMNRAFWSTISPYATPERLNDIDNGPYQSNVQRGPIYSIGSREYVDTGYRELKQAISDITTGRSQYQITSGSTISSYGVKPNSFSNVAYNPNFSSKEKLLPGGLIVRPTVHIGRAYLGY